MPPLSLSSSTSPPVPLKTLHPSYPAQISSSAISLRTKKSESRDRSRRRRRMTTLPGYVLRLRFWYNRVGDDPKVYVRDVLELARPSSSFTIHEYFYCQQRTVLSYQTNKSTTNSFNPPISSSTPHKDLVSSGVGTLLVSSALHPISSTMLFFIAVMPRNPASFQSLISLK